MSTHLELRRDRPIVQAYFDQLKADRGFYSFRQNLHKLSVYLQPFDRYWGRR